jgi:hypothetical protein
MKSKIILVILCCFLLGGCGQERESSQAANSETSIEQKNETQQEPSQSEETSQNTNMQISVTNNEYTIVYELNDSLAAKNLYEQLPLTMEVQNFSTNEKIFYPPEELDVSDAPEANTKAGSLCYYSPWADVVMFYQDYGTASSLYELGTAVSGVEYIGELSGTIEISVNEED